MGQVCGSGPGGGRSRVDAQPTPQQQEGEEGQVIGGGANQPPSAREIMTDEEEGAGEEPLPNGGVTPTPIPNLLRLCLLGTTESGKTTVFEQIRKLSKIPVPSFELQLRKTFIYDLVINSMQQILEHIQKCGAMDQFDQENQKYARLILGGCNGRTSGEPLKEEEFEALSLLWDSSLVREYYDKREQYGLNDSVGYFMESLPRIYEKNFQPVHEDLMMAYIPTVGVQDFHFEYNKKEFRVFDVGRAKLDAHKWSSIYENLNALIFTMAISTYDQKAEEVEEYIQSGEGEGAEEEVRSIKRPTQLEESLQLLRQICSEGVFASTPIHVFLNECDVFKEKSRRVPLSNYYPEYKGMLKDRCPTKSTFTLPLGSSEKDALEYMRGLVKGVVESAIEDSPLALEGSKRTGPIEYHFTCCINTKEMQKLLSSILKHIA